MTKKEIFERIIIGLLLNKYKDNEVTEDLVIAIEKEVNELYKKALERLGGERKSTFVPPRF
jgi:hypothetical protein